MPTSSFSMLGFCLAQVCAGLAQAVTVSVSSHGTRPVVSASAISLDSPTTSASASSLIPETWEEGVIKTCYLGLSTQSLSLSVHCLACGFHVNYLVQEEASEVRVKWCTIYGYSNILLGVILLLCSCAIGFPPQAYELSSNVFLASLCQARVVSHGVALKSNKSGR